MKFSINNITKSNYLIAKNRWFCYNMYGDIMSIKFQEYVLYEDNHLLVVHKPAGILSQADNTKDLDILTLAKSYLKEKYQKPGNVYVGLVHRLDRMTEGVMVLAKTSKAASRLSEDIRNNDWHKVYFALVLGKVESGHKLTDWLDHENDTKKMMVTKPGVGQRSELSFNVLGTNSKESLLKVNLLTGRHHQIRVQLAHYGYPLVGDTLYGNSKQHTDLMLACALIKFKHPTTKVELTFTSLPKGKKWQKYLKDFNITNV